MFHRSEITKLNAILPINNYDYRDILTKEEIDSLKFDTYSLGRLQKIANRVIVPKYKDSV